MSLDEDKRIYAALALPNEAIANGGVEILRAGIIDDEVFVSARRAFKDHAQWGEVLASVARRVAILTSAEDTEFTEAEILADIEEAFLAALGAPVVAPRRTKGRTAKGKAENKAKPKGNAKPQARTKANTKTKMKSKSVKPRARKSARSSARKAARRGKR